MEITLTYFLTNFLPYLLRGATLFVKGIISLESRLSRAVVELSKGMMKEQKVANILSILCLLGPLIFLPNVWSAWTADDISSMSNPSWTIMIFVHLAVYARLSHDEASPCTRISILFWMMEMILITLAVLVR